MPLPLPEALSNILLTPDINTLPTTGSTEFNGKPLTSPNDCVISRKDGALWFTDPDYVSNMF